VLLCHLFRMLSFGSPNDKSLPGSLKTHADYTRYAGAQAALMNVLPSLSPIRHSKTPCPQLFSQDTPTNHPVILQRLKRYWSSNCPDPDITMLWAAEVTCFIGFFRAGEICIPTLNSFDKERHLAWGDVLLNNRSDPSCMKVHLKYSKTDQLGQGVDIFIGKTGCTPCPIQAAVAYMAVCGSSEGPYFRLSCSHPLTKPYFTSHIREALQAIGLPESQFASHSFRIGAATTAASAGLEDSTICTLGRWNSSAFLLYIRTPREQLAMFSRALLAPELTKSQIVRNISSCSLFLVLLPKLFVVSKYVCLYMFRGRVVYGIIRVGSL